MVWLDRASDKIPTRAGLLPQEIGETSPTLGPPNHPVVVRLANKKQRCPVATRGGIGDGGWDNPGDQVRSMWNWPGYQEVITTVPPPESKSEQDFSNMG